MALDPNLSGTLPTEEGPDDLDFDECLQNIAELVDQANTLLKNLVQGRGVDGSVLEHLRGSLDCLADEVGYQWLSCNDPEEICPVCKGSGTVDPNYAEYKADALKPWQVREGVDSKY